MDHPCHKCNQAVEDGTPFCSNCGAPQIRVTVASPPPQSPPAEGGTALSPEHVLTPGFPHITGIPGAGLWPRAMRPCALAAGLGVLSGVLGLHPFVGVLVSGSFAVTFYRHRNPGFAIRTGTGARLGALSGFFFFLLSIVLEGFAVAVLHKGGEIRSEMIGKVQETAARYPGPGMDTLMELVKTPHGLNVLIVVSLILTAVVLPILASLGGAITAAFVGRKKQ